jgi:hypothetical protein
LKYANRQRRWIHQLWESRTDGEYFKLCKILREFPDKFREYYRMDIKTFDYTLDIVKDDLQGYSNFRKCTEAEEKLIVALRYVLVVVVRININYIRRIVNAIKIQYNLKGNYTRKIKSYTKLQ